MEKVIVKVPSSSANLGIGYDIWSLALEQPSLTLTYTKGKPGAKIVVENNTQLENTDGLIPCYSGMLALENFFKVFNIKDGAHLLYSANDYPIGGLGRSGAEAVSAVFAASLIYDNKLTTRDLIALSSKVEPNRHADNVTASVCGGFNIIFHECPSSGFVNNITINPPSNLGVLIGYSSHKKTSGTTGARNVLSPSLFADDITYQLGLVSAATAWLVSGDINNFLSLIVNHNHQEACRANAGMYGNFRSEEFQYFKMKLFKDFSVSLNVSGAGPSMIFLYNKSNVCSSGLANNKLFKNVVTSWFEDRGIAITLKETKIARIGAHKYLE